VDNQIRAVIVPGTTIGRAGEIPCIAPVIRALHGKRRRRRKKRRRRRNIYSQKIINNNNSQVVCWLPERQLSIEAGRHRIS